MNIGIGQINTTIGDFDGNRRKIVEAARRGVEAGADLVVFPEMSLCGYPPNDLLDHDAFAQESLKSLRRLQHEAPAGVAIAVGYVDRNRAAAGKPLTNSVAVIVDGEILHTQAKTLLPTYDVFDETRYFEPAATRKVFSFRGVRIGVAICEDIWWETEAAPGTRYPVDPVADLLDAGAEILIAPSASPYYAGKVHVRQRLISRISRSSGVPVIYVNMVGGNDSLIFDGQSIVTDRSGALVHRAAAFEEDFSVVDTEAARPPVSLDMNRYEEIRQALVLGIRDYLAKTGFTSVHLGLSGGIDSALVAVLAAEAIGAGKVSAFGLPSRYSSAGSVDDAKRLCENLGVSYRVLPIEGPFAALLGALEGEFAGTSPDLTEENIQARIRGILLMAYSNKFGSLLLTTGNKSELAVGYCTLYGDMCGSLAVIGDLFKTEVYGLCRHINSNGEIIPEPIITKPPSAELRPDQKDSDSLPEYDVLDKVLERYVLGNRTSAEIEAEGYPGELVRRVITLVGRAEYKRRQAPPVLKVSPRAFGTGRRMPIARRIYEA
jgi:NAD+ synthase (glutamine-hydrolysing)